LVMPNFLILASALILVL